MKILSFLPVTFAILAALSLTGCISSGQRSEPTDRATYERVQSNAEGYRNPDGSLDGTYLVEVLLGQPGSQAKGPVFSPPPLNGGTR